VQLTFDLDFNVLLFFYLYVSTSCPFRCRSQPLRSASDVQQGAAKKTFCDYWVRKLIQSLCKPNT